MNKYISGNTLRLSAEFTLPVGVDDPTVEFKLLQPDNNIITVTAEKDADGQYHADYICDMEGLWRSRVEMSGTLVQANELTFLVYSTPFA